MMHCRPFSNRSGLRVPLLVFFVAFPLVACGQIVGFFPAVDSISVIGSCTPPSLTCHVLEVPGGVDTVEIRPLWDDRMYAGAPFGTQIPRCFFVVLDSANTNQYRLRMTWLWPDSGTSYPIAVDSTFLVFGRFMVALIVEQGGAGTDSATVLFSADAVGAAGATQSEVPDARRPISTFPNPFNAGTTIRYAVAQSAVTTLCVYNMLGQEVARLVNRHLNSGLYAERFEAGDLPSGVYLCRLQSGAQVYTLKMVSMR
jgi:hypothetical protein